MSLCVWSGGAPPPPPRTLPGIGAFGADAGALGREVWQRIPKAELAKMPRIFRESSWKLGAKPPISQNILGILPSSALGILCHT